MVSLWTYENKDRIASEKEEGQEIPVQSNTRIYQDCHKGESS